MEAKSVTWKSSGEGDDKLSNKTRKRVLAYRDQPTWVNCKQHRSHEQLSVNKKHNKVLELRNRVLPNLEYGTLRTNSSASRPYSARTRSSISSKKSNKTEESIAISNPVQDIVNENPEDDENFIQSTEKGRDIFIRTANEKLRLSVPTKFKSFTKTDVLKNEKHQAKLLRQKEKNNTDYLKSQRLYKNLKMFRVPSASASHNTSDVSIGLRQIHRLTVNEMKIKELHRKSKQNSSNVIDNQIVLLTELTCCKFPNQWQSPQSYKSSLTSDESLSALGPGEDYLKTLGRKLSVSAPATINSTTTESTSLSTTHPKSSRKGSARNKPILKSSFPFIEREWNPKNLQRYSIQEPWTSKTSTSRYFPKFSNLQDLHCRNPYLVPNSILYQTCHF